MADGRWQMAGGRWSDLSRSTRRRDARLGWVRAQTVEGEGAGAGGGGWWVVVGGGRARAGGRRGASALIRCRGRARPDHPSSDNKPMPQVPRKLVTYHLTSTSLCLPPADIVREHSRRGCFFLSPVI